MSKNQDTKYKEAKIFNNPHIPIQVPQTLENNVAFNLIKNKTLSGPRAVLELKCVVWTMWTLSGAFWKHFHRLVITCLIKY